MASKRSIKKEIRTVCKFLIIGAVATVREQAAEAPEKQRELFGDILELEYDYISRVNCYEKAPKDKGVKRIRKTRTLTYFKTIRQRFHSDVDAIAKRINAQL